MDDPVGASLAETVTNVVSYSRHHRDATLRVISGGAHARGIDALVATPDGAYDLKSPLVGAHNVENLLAALGVLIALEYPAARAIEALATAKGAPGRLERVAPSAGESPFEVLVDYAHTPDALERVLATLRVTTPGRIVCVFGCGGDRDPTKRPRMGAAVAGGADIAFVTSDNPRTEDPQTIADQAAEGLRAAGRAEVSSRDPDVGEFAVVLDRRSAITRAVELALPGDVVLIAGKGHEPYQEVHGVRAPFDDRDEARRALDRAMARHGRE
jgi:UDP-N-acetylmuramoyl-L-alanyl-D-glutamate--2,6-diaminopimelate ligase